MPNLDQVALLRQEIEGLKLELQEVKSKVGIEVNPDVVKIKMQARQEDEIDITEAESAGLAWSEHSFEDRPEDGSSPRERESMRKGSTQDISLLGANETISMVCFDRKSAWSIPLVVVFSEAFDTITAAVILIFNLIMQSLFISIISGRSFLGEDYSNQVDDAASWRRSFAHDSKYVDLTDRSLASRVCNEDGSLIFSNGQTEILTHINAFLGMSKDEFELPFFNPGVLLSVLCILLWNLCIFKEYRSIWHALQGMYFVPKASSTTFGDGALQTMSRGRVFLLSVVCLIRLVVATMLLYVGSVWLSRTTSISELMLNAVALEAIIHVDEFLFSALTPTKVQYRIQNLPPVKIKQNGNKYKLENIIFLLLLSAALALPFLLFLQPLTQTMLDVKWEMCGGNRTFIVAFNSDVQQAVGKATRPIGAEFDGETPMVEKAVAEHIFAFINYSDSRSQHRIEKYIDFTNTAKAFRKWSEQSMDDYGALYPICLEEWFPEGINSAKVREYNNETGLLYDLWSLHFRSAAELLGYPNFTDQTLCADLVAYCDLPQARLLRFACGMTCGCDKLMVNPLYRVRSQGCNQGCLQKMWGASAYKNQRFRYLNFESNCDDIDPQHPAWQEFWDNYLDALSDHIDTNLDSFVTINIPLYRYFLATLVKSAGCSRIAGFDDLSNTEWCRGHPGLYRPLAWLCPKTCGCNTTGNAERDNICFGYDYCRVSVINEPNTYQARENIKSYLRLLGKQSLFIHAPRIQDGGHKLP